MSSKESAEYKRMMLLDQLETLLEEMDELGVTTRDELLARITALHGELDDAEDP